MALNMAYLQRNLPSMLSNVRNAVQSASSGKKVPIVDNPREAVMEAFESAGMDFPANKPSSAKDVSTISAPADLDVSGNYSNYYQDAIKSGFDQEYAYAL